MNFVKTGWKSLVKSVYIMVRELYRNYFQLCAFTLIQGESEKFSEPIKWNSFGRKTRGIGRSWFQVVSNGEFSKSISKC